MHPKWYKIELQETKGKQWNEIFHHEIDSLIEIFVKNVAMNKKMFIVKTQKC